VRNTAIDQPTPPPSSEHPAPTGCRGSAAPIYILVVGIVVGLALSPYVLGRFAPERYEQLFPAGDTVAKLEALDADYSDRIARLEHTGVSAVEVERVGREYQMEHEELIQQVEKQRAARQAPRRTAILIALLVVFFIETLFEAPAHPVVRRLTIVRCALASVWIALLLACPEPLRQLPLIFTAILLLVALAVGLVPLPGRRNA